MAGLRISELADRTGVPRTTLRYYERVGLLHPGRDGSGYRRYVDDDVEIVEFVVSVKQLRLTLEEIGSLVRLREEGCCELVRRQLRARALEKLQETRDAIADLNQFADELGDLCDRLAGPGPGRCGPDCGCDDHGVAAHPALTLLDHRPGA